MNPGDKIYINDAYSGGGINVVYFSQDLNETQMLVQCNERYSVINKNIIVSESDYNEYQDSIYKDILKKFQDFISCNRINESMVLRIIEDLKLKRH